MAAQEKEMSFLGHLEELRWHLVRSAAAIFIFAITFFVFAEQVYTHFLLAHTSPNFITYQLFCDFFNLFGMESDFCSINIGEKKLQSIKVTSQLMNSIWSSLILGLIVAFPYLLWEIWRFVSPGLTSTTSTTRKTRAITYITSSMKTW